MACCYLLYISIIIIVVPILLLLNKKNRILQSLFNKHVVITGGSQGIGKAAGIEAATQGAHVTILARNEAVLKSACKEIKSACLNSTQMVKYRIVDVTKFDILQEAIKDIENEKEIDVLINCAGMAVCGTVADIADHDVINLVNLNLLGSYFATKAVIPAMKKRKNGIIILTGSQASLLGLYGLGIYSATKFALRGLAETLSMELKPYNISVTLSLPPDTDTPGFERENIGKPKETQLICESGGLFKPEVVGRQMLKDAMVGNFYSFNGFESFMLTTLNAGMTPLESISQLFFQLVLMGPIRVATVFINKNFENIINKCKLERERNLKNK